MHHDEIPSPCLTGLSRLPLLNYPSHVYWHVRIRGISCFVPLRFELIFRRTITSDRSLELHLCQPWYCKNVLKKERNRPLLRLNAHVRRAAVWRFLRPGRSLDWYWCPANDHDITPGLKNYYNTDTCIKQVSCQSFRISGVSNKTPNHKRLRFATGSNHYQMEISLYTTDWWIIARHFTNGRWALRHNADLRLKKSANVIYGNIERTFDLLARDGIFLILPVIDRS